MCGIAGLILKTKSEPPSPTVLEALNKALAHRGPDGAHQCIIDDTALLHTRLAIIDLKGGDQPLYAGSAALIANGEIYNYKELRSKFTETEFKTHSDSELPLQLWLHEGTNYVEKLRGMYAIALHDRSNNTTVLSRDPFGIKPLYLAKIDQGYAFASEPQALIAAGLVKPKIHAQARRELLQLQFSSGSDTIFEGIRRVLPGETLIFRDGEILERRHEPALPDAKPERITESEALKRLDKALEESIDLHLRSDVPYGMFLSGGVDSATILSVASRLKSQPMRTFTAGFDAPGAADEREKAERVARVCGAEHESILVTEEMVWRHLPEIVACMDDPVTDFAIIPTWFLAQRARAEVKVVLSGEGGDEIFAGYGRYRSAMRPWWLGGKKLRTRGAFTQLDVLRDTSPHWRDGVALAEAEANTPHRTRLAAAQATDCADWLAHGLLTKLDRCLMAHGVEGRTPFLDRGIVEAAFLLPDALKVQGRSGKWILRQWLQQHLPEARPFDRKQGFTVPVGAWINNQGARLGELVARQPGVIEIAEPAKVIRLFKDCAAKREGNAAWRLLFYALWHQRHILGLSSEGDVFEALCP